jgi:hypothetical protein
MGWRNDSYLGLIQKQVFILAKNITDLLSFKFPQMNLKGQGGRVQSGLISLRVVINGRLL